MKKVNWMEWGEVAFKKAQQESKMLFVTIGYTYCEAWERMEKECFEDERVAQLLNEQFVAVWVDRESRPDIDAMYMVYLEAATGISGWPMSLFLTEEGKPIYAGAYFSIEDRPGQIGFLSIAEKLEKAWHSERDSMRENAQKATETLKQFLAKPFQNEDLAEMWSVDEIVQKGYQLLSSHYDYHEGGFSSSPKFAQPALLQYGMEIVEYWRQYEPQHEHLKWLEEMLYKTLRVMARAGIYDQLGGGFYRCSMDAYWHLPHFEKTLYDQALLIAVYTRAYQLYQKPWMAELIEEIVLYVEQNLDAGNGLFHSAEMVLGIKKSEQDHYYLWQASKVDELLGQKNGSIFRYYYSILKEGNIRAEYEQTSQYQGWNHLFCAHTIKGTASYFKKTEDEVLEILRKGREQLLEYRRSKPNLRKNTRINIRWNGYFLAGLAKAGCSFQNKKWLSLAEQGLEFIRGEHWMNGRLKNEAIVNAGDYAALIYACLEMAQEDASYLKWATELQKAQDECFWSEEKAAYLTCSLNHADHLYDLVDEFDGAEPSANALSAQNACRFYQKTLQITWLEKVKKMGRSFWRLDAEEIKSQGQMAQAQLTCGILLK